jgi:signal transduction histidine kinase
MNVLYTYSIAPVLAVSLLLFFTAVLRARGAKGLGAYCLAIAVWSGALLLSVLPATAHVGQKLVATGGYVVAAYLHAAYSLTGQKRFALVWLAYLMATAITLLHLFWPGMLFDPLALRAGPLFWPAMAFAGAVSLFPVWHLARHFLRASGRARLQLLSLCLAGVLGYLGASSNALLLSHGVRLPLGLFVVLASLFILANVVRQQQDRAMRRILQRSLTYSAVAAFLSAGFLFGVLVFLDSSGQPLLTGYRISVLFLLCMAALAFEPLRQHLGEVVGRRLLRKTTGVSEMAEELAVQEQRADQASRLAELGAFTSAVAHEVRGPLGVLSAQLRSLERADVDAKTVVAMRAQIKRAERFVDDLLAYGRPRPLELREIDLGALVKLAFGTARQALGQEESTIELIVSSQPEAITVEADQSQLLQLFGVLLENAMLALSSRSDGTIRVEIRVAGHAVRMAVEDNGPGIPAEILDRVFEPFVTGGGKRDRAGTGLGLAIARGIVERHGGSMAAGSSELGGARLEITMPLTQRVMAAATEPRGSHER